MSNTKLIRSKKTKISTLNSLNQGLAVLLVVCFFFLFFIMYFRFVKSNTNKDSTVYGNDTSERGQFSDQKSDYINEVKPLCAVHITFGAYLNVNA